MKKIKKLWDEAGKFTAFQWIVLYLLTFTTLCSIFTVIVEYVLWTKLGGKP